MLALVGAPYVAFAQPASSLAPDDSFRGIVETIEEIRSLHGLDSPHLIDPLTALGLVYQEQGQHDLAEATIERARQLLRVNYGLHSLEEALLIRQLVRIEEARGNVEAAWELEQKLLILVERHPNDLRTVAILREIADKRMDVLRRYQAGEFPPQIILGCYYAYDEVQRCHSGSRRVVIANLSSEAAMFRAEADEILLRRALLVASPCERPEMPEIPDDPELPKREVRSAKTEVVQYLRGMSAYVACAEVQYEHAASTGASPSELARLAAEKDAAAAELEGSRALYVERFGPLMQPVVQPSNFRYRRETRFPPSLGPVDGFAAFPTG